MTLPRLVSKQNFTVNLIGFFGAVFVMWFGVFKLHLYDATGIKQPVSAVVLALDWILIATYGLTILYITIKKRKSVQYQRLSAPVKVSSYLASAMVIFGLLALLAVIVFYLLLAIAFWHWQF